VSFPGDGIGVSVPSELLSVIRASRSIPYASKSVGVFLLSKAGRTDYLIAALA